MSRSKKIRVAVLYGGRSQEHEVSLTSAMNVIQHLDRNYFEVIPIGIDKKGSWFLGDEGMLRLDQTETLTQKILFKPNALGQHLQTLQGMDWLSATLPNERIFDVVFPVIHGTLCEDGTVQGLLELAEVPYVGCGVLSSALGMDKDVSKRLIRDAGMKIAPFIAINQGAWEKDPLSYCDRIDETLRYPLFVKPANTGSSVGVEKIKTPLELLEAIDRAFRYDTKIVVEQGIDAREIEVAVLESLDYGADPVISVIGEVRPTAQHEFYSYASKYLDEKGAELIIPAELSVALQKKIQRFAKEIFNLLECEGMARVDLFLEKETHEIYFNEINTIPGFTAISMYPKLMAASGMSYSALLTHLIQLAIARFTRKKELCRDFTKN